MIASARASARHPAPEPGERTLTVAVAGNPNCGKSTLINAVAGSRLQVGNWPGVTVEKKEAVLPRGDVHLRLVDLPGTYSLSPYSDDERVAREALVEERPDVVVNVVDATNLERNLYLTVQLLELGVPLVVALNIYDEAEEKGLRIDVATLAERLGVPVVPTSATRRTGLEDLLDAAVAEARRPSRRPRPAYGPDLEAAISEIAAALERDPSTTLATPRRRFALELLERSASAAEQAGGVAETLTGPAVRHLRRGHGPDLEALVAEARYGVAAGIAREVVKRPPVPRRELTERIDRWVLNRFLGIPIFLGAMWLVFKLTFDVSGPFADWIDGVTTGPAKRLFAFLLGAIAAPDWTVSLVNDGIVAGVGFVLVFVPVIFAMMFFITLLEGSGYMARAAFVMDRAMHAIGLHGKSFIPMLLGFGCNVPAIYATRALESRRDRVLTALLLPLMSCGARLPVYVVFAGIFFPLHAGTAIWSLYVLGVVLAVLVGLAFKRTLFRGTAPAFVMELPPYRMPSMRSVLVHTWEKGKHFLVKAGTYILAVSVIVWFLLHLPWGVQDKRDSYLGRAGQVVAPALEPLGFGTWEAAASLITGVIAKEIVVGTMGEIYAPEAGHEEETPPTPLEDLQQVGTSFVAAFAEAGKNVVSTFSVSTLSFAPDEGGPSPLAAALAERFTPLSAYAFMVFVLLYWPCVVVLIALRQEFGGWRWAGVAMAYQTALSWGAAAVVYQGGRLLGLGG
ncbi:MAG TPA: ferrous iron transport protein B [Anaeromyxobacter sp.]|nr:ferrous iron transport protein B [Anaeromyxobacter sp.]